jgi:hypothetical protein
MHCRLGLGLRVARRGENSIQKERRDKHQQWCDDPTGPPFADENSSCAMCRSPFASHHHCIGAALRASRNTMLRASMVVSQKHHPCDSSHRANPRRDITFAFQCAGCRWVSTRPWNTRSTRSHHAWQASTTNEVHCMANWVEKRVCMVRLYDYGCSAWWGGV